MRAGKPNQAASATEHFSRDAGRYDRTRRQLLPFFDAFYGAALAALPFGADAPARVLDLGAGTGLLSALVREALPRARLSVTDGAAAMLEGARARLGASPQITYRVLDMRIDPIPGPFDAIISALAIHHLEHAQKQGLFRRIHDALVPGGVFVNADQMAVGADAHRAWLAEVRATGIAEDEVAAALGRMAHDRNASLADQLAWLGEAGMRRIEVHFERHFFVVYSARRTEAAS